MVLLAASLVPAPARAGSYDPVLVLGQAVSTGSVQPTTLILSGTWSFDDILQVDFPLNVVVRQGDVFVRYAVGASSGVSGAFAPLADGLSSQEVAGLEAAGSADASARMTRLTAHQIVLALPPVFAASPVTVVLYAKLPREGVLFSNVVTSVVQVGP